MKSASATAKILTKTTIQFCELRQEFSQRNYMKLDEKFPKSARIVFG